MRGPAVRLDGIGRYGQITDIPPFDLPPGALSETINVVCDGGGVTRIPGMILSYDLKDAATNPDGYPGAASPAGLPVWFENWFQEGDGRLTYATEDERFFDLNNSGSFDEVTPGGLALGGTKWSSTSFYDTAIWTNSSNAPFAMRPTDTTLVSLPGWPDNDPGFTANWTAEVIRPYKNFLVALRLVKDGVDAKNRVQWSDASDGGLPSNWNELDPTSLAGGAWINEKAGRVIDGYQLNDSFMIYTDTSIYALRLVGGPFTMRLDRVGSRGILGRECVVEFDTSHFCIGPGAFYVFDGNRITLVGEDKVVKTFFQRAVRTDNVHTSHDPLEKKIYIFYQSDSNVDYADYALVWDYVDDVWTEFEHIDYQTCRAQYGPRSSIQVTFADTEAGSGVENSPVPPGSLFSSANIAFSELDAQQGDLAVQLLTRNNTINSFGKVYLREGDEYTSRAARYYIDFDALLGDQGGLRTQAIKHINRIYPQIVGSGRVNFQFGSALQPEGQIRWNNPVPFEIGQDYKVDDRISGRYFCWRVFTQEQAAFTLTGFDIEVELAGER